MAGLRVARLHLKSKYNGIIQTNHDDEQTKDILQEKE